MAGYATHVDVTIHADDSITVVDNGRGIPVDMHPTEKMPGVEMVMTMLHAGGKFDKRVGYKVSGGLHGVGVSVVNALSEWLKVDVRRDGKRPREAFARGDKTASSRCTAKTRRSDGTTISFKPDPTIFEETELHLRHAVEPACASWRSSTRA